jgi:hypothetical protein
MLIGRELNFLTGEIKKVSGTRNSFNKERRADDAKKRKRSELIPSDIRTKRFYLPIMKGKC